MLSLSQETMCCYKYKCEHDWAACPIQYLFVQLHKRPSQLVCLPRASPGCLAAQAMLENWLQVCWVDSLQLLPVWIAKGRCKEVVKHRSGAELEGEKAKCKNRRKNGEMLEMKMMYVNLFCICTLLTLWCRCVQSRKSESWGNGSQQHLLLTWMPRPERSQDSPTPGFHHKIRYMSTPGGVRKRYVYLWSFRRLFKSQSLCKKSFQ